MRLNGRAGLLCGIIVFTMSSPTAAADAARALAAFLEFRETDMELWTRAGESLGLSRTAMLALARIIRAHDAGTPLRQVDLGRALLASPAGISATIDTLEGKGLVRRERSATDRRAVALVPGEHAGPIVDEVLGADARFVEQAAALTPEALGGFITLMDHMNGVSARKYQGA